MPITVGSQALVGANDSPLRSFEPSLVQSDSPAVVTTPLREHAKLILDLLITIRCVTQVCLPPHAHTTHRRRSTDSQRVSILGMKDGTPARTAQGLQPSSINGPTRKVWNTYLFESVSIIDCSTSRCRRRPGDPASETKGIGHIPPFVAAACIYTLPETGYS